jgi:hypothetical protein
MCHNESMNAGACIILITLFAMSGCTNTPSLVTLRPNDPALSQLAWLAGSWIADESPHEHIVNEEHWTQPSGGTMFAMNRTVQASHAGNPAKTVFFEYLRIEQSPAGIVYLASPKGRQPPTPFKMVECQPAPPRVVFENAQHDFPKRLIYWRDGNTLHGRIEGEQDGQPASEEWTWRRARFD